MNGHESIKQDVFLNGCSKVNLTVLHFLGSRGVYRYPKLENPIWIWRKNLVMSKNDFFFFLSVSLKEIELVGKLCFLFSTQDGTVVSLTVNELFVFRSCLCCSSE